MSTVKYYGKYRAKVVNIDDPEKRGRIRVLCPRVLGEFRSAWCEPCIPVAYDFGGDFALPKLGEFVWVEFESGNPNKPIYTGGLWSTNKSPSNSYNSKDRLITWGDCKILMHNGESISLSVGSSNITINQDGISINSPNVTINGRYPLFDIPN